MVISEKNKRKKISMLRVLSRRKSLYAYLNIPRETDTKKVEEIISARKDELVTKEMTEAKG